MTINKAVEIAMDGQSPEKYIYNCNFPDIKIMPDLGIPCVIMMRDGSKPAPNWQPTAEDLMSDRWEVCE